MSRAFVKEEEGARWTPPPPPPPPRAYRLVWADAQGSRETVRETDDLLDALRWLASRERPGFELRGAAGELLATNGV